MLKINIRNRIIYEGIYGVVRAFNQNYNEEKRVYYKNDAIKDILKVCKEFKNNHNIESIQWDEKTKTIYIVEDLPF